MLHCIQTVIVSALESTFMWIYPNKSLYNIEKLIVKIQQHLDYKCTARNCTCLSGIFALHIAHKRHVWRVEQMFAHVIAHWQVQRFIATIWICILDANKHIYSLCDSAAKCHPKTYRDALNLSAYNRRDSKCNRSDVYTVLKCIIGPVHIICASDAHNDALNDLSHSHPRRLLALQECIRCTSLITTWPSSRAHT